MQYVEYVGTINPPTTQATFTNLYIRVKLSTKNLKNIFLPTLKSLSFVLDLILLGLVVSSTNLNRCVVVVGVVNSVETFSVVGTGSAFLPVKVISSGQQILGLLLVKPQENFAKNLSFSLVVCCSRIFSLKDN